MRTFETSFGQIPLDLLIGIGECIQLLRIQRNKVSVNGSSWNHPLQLPQRVARIGSDIQVSKVPKIWTYRSEEAFDYTSLCRLLEALPAAVFRMKGKVLLAIAIAWFKFKLLVIMAAYDWTS